MEILPPLNVDLSAINLNLTKVLEFQSLKRKIKPLFSILGKSPTTTLETLLCSEDDIEEVAVTTKIIEEAKHLYQELHEAVEKQKTETLNLWVDIQLIWKEIEDKQEYELGFTNGRNGILQALKIMHKEQLAARADREQRLQEYIVNIRGEIADLWKQCMVSDEEKQLFQPFTSATFDERTLDLHKMEAAKLKAFHEKNQVLFKKLEKRKILWQRMKELQAKLEDPNKFTNRGATLLNNQKEMNIVTNQIPKLEETLKQLAVQFEKENGRKLLVRGQAIHQIFDTEWAEYKQATCKRLHRPLTNTTIMSATPGMIRTAEKRGAPIRHPTTTAAIKKLRPNLHIAASTPHLNQHEEQENSG